MSVLDRFRAAYNAFKHPYPGDPEDAVSEAALMDGLLPDDHRERLAILRDYYEATAYARLNDAANRRGVAGLKMYDNPAFQAVEFHTAHLFPGSLSEALPLRFPRAPAASPEEPEIPEGSEEPGEEDPEPPEGPLDPEALRKAVLRVWEWSNWSSEKQRYVRWLARDGEVFLQAATREDDAGSVVRAYAQIVDAYDVSEFEEDERGFLVFLRLDVELDPEEHGGQQWWHTEVWDKREDLHRVWIHRLGLDAKLDDLGDPEPLVPAGTDPETGEDLFEETGEVDERITDQGFDFVPYVHVRFVDTGSPAGRGVGVYEKFVVPMDEINRAVNRIHQTYFRYDRPDMVLRRNEPGKGPADLRPEADVDDEGNEADEVTVGDETLYRLPGTAVLEQMIPNIPYDAGISLIDKRVERLSESLAELRFFQDVDKGDPSGISRRIRLQPAVSRAVEARTNAEAGLVRATQMCLTLGRLAGLEGFAELGTFEAGDFAFEIEPRGVLHVSDLERFEEDKREAEVLGLYAKLPPALLRKYLEDRGYEDDVIEAVVSEAAEPGAPAIPQSLVEELEI